MVTVPLAMAQTLLDAAGRADYLTVLLPELNKNAGKKYFVGHSKMFRLMLLR
jgi:putative ABC transport system permease protein